LLKNFIELVGFSVCHQLDSRSLAFGEILTPVCSRCAGIYTGFTVSAILLFLMFRKKQSDLPPAYVLVIMSIFFLSTVFDGFASYLNLYETNNIIRFSTGVLCGTSLIVVLFPVFNFQYYARSRSERIFKRPLMFTAFIVILIAFIIFTLQGFEPLGIFYYYFTGISIIFTFFFLSLVIVLLIPFFAQRAKKLFSMNLAIPVFIALALASVELFVSYKIHQFMEKLAGL
jgi:uncharacterized membrane protein